MTSPSVLLNASCHKKTHEHIWFMGGDLNGFRDIKQFMKLTGWGKPGHALEVFLVIVTECVLL